nr:hypothetical protein [Deltaproteobacteria bacterium]
MARYLGIEVTESQLKGAVLKTAYKKLLLETVFAVNRPPGPEGLQAATRELASLVQGLLASASPGAQPAELDGIYASLPGHEASIRAISLPRAVWKRGEKALLAELEGAVPFDVDDAVVDAQVTAPGDPVPLLAVAAIRDRVKNYLDGMILGGLEPRELGVSPMALGELAAEIPELAVPGPVLLVYAQDSRAEVAVLRGGVTVFARTVTALTTPAARARAMRQSVAAWAAADGPPIERAYLCGLEAQWTQQPVLEATLLPMELVMPLPSGAIQLGPSAGEFAFWESPVAVALAARGLGRSKRVDLRKGALAVSGGAQVLRERAPYLAAAALAMVGFWGAATWARYQGLAAERNRLQETLRTVTQEVYGEPVEDPTRAMAMARGDSHRDDVDPMPGADAFDVLGVLSQRINDTVRHDVEQLDIRGEHVQLQGVVSTLSDRDKVVEWLSSYPCFPEVRPGRVTTTPGDNRQKYTLDIEFRCPGARTERPRTTGTGGGTTGGSSNQGGRSGGGA